MKPFKKYISEEKNKNRSVVFSFGRNQPPTAGHGHIIGHVMKHAADTGAEHVVFTSGSGPTHKVKAVREKNPLHPHEKVETMRAFFPGANIQHHEKVASPFHAIEHLKGQGFRHVKMVVGADRQKEFQEKMAPYAKHFKSFEVVSPGKQRMDVEGMEVSGTAARKHAAAGDYGSFRKIMPADAPEAAVKQLYGRLRKPVKPPVKKTKRKIVEMILSYIAEARPRTAKEKTKQYYSKEYKEHQSSPKAIKERGQRWTARRRAAVRAAKRKLGSKAANKTRDQLIKIGQGLLKGKDVDHKKPLSRGGSNGNGNVRVVSRSYNRSRNNNISEADEGATRYLSKRLLNKDRAARPNPEPITQRKSIPGIPPLPKA